MAKLGGNKRSAVVRVQTQTRAEEILSICNEHGWKVIVSIEPNKPEDISDVEQLLNPYIVRNEAPKIGRNEPCPCGSGKKYKKCCLIRTKTHISYSIKDYGPAQLSESFFRENPVKEISAARLMYSCLLNPQVEEIAAKTTKPFIPEQRWQKEEEKINQETTLEGLLKIIEESPDPVNHALLKKKILNFSNLAVLKIVEKLKDNQDDVFVELGVRIIHESKIDCSTQLLGILDSIKHPHTLSLVCLLLGLIGPREAIQPVWNYYHFLRDNYPEETYEQGPLLALYEFKERFGSSGGSN